MVSSDAEDADSAADTVSINSADNLVFLGDTAWPVIDSDDAGFDIYPDGDDDEPLGWVDLFGGVLTLFFLVFTFFLMTLLCSLSPWAMGISVATHAETMYWFIASTTLLVITLFGVLGVGVWRMGSENKHLRLFSVAHLSCVSVAFMSWITACCFFW